MSYTMYIWGGLLGLAFGSAVAFLNSIITKRYIKKNSEKAGPEGTASVMGMNLARQLVNVAALFAVFLTRKLIPLPFAATLIGTALGLTVVSVILVYRLSKKY